MNAIVNILPFLVFLALLWFTYINISYGVTMYLATKEDHTLTSCLSDSGKYFYVILLILYIGIFIICSLVMVLSAVNNNLNSIYTPLNILTVITLGVSILLQQIIYVGHRQMMIGKIKLDYRKIKRVTYPRTKKLRFVYGQKTFETSLRFIDDFKLKKALQKAR
ncbi:hypothetical protein CWE04_10655 [Thomasclavelia cocleata]|uniref:DUF5673 domain-containing protein n=1 Tax=Thomasclavelia cocleata TaxID=69824 RepID=A0A1I0GNX1_9FIRM|nr:hypothetical protein [Thomasclavelia cocleata]MCR1960725.1 hypothetical protein [Thomasclavelia cocleata]NDO41395.1 hypothetical protein [Thomasclavelia cocleata]PJN80086.1 hypothetical protein CWE04_10655 [Thomasclavelia cocleata]SET73020.1 hypothetical protein SAMN04489758_13323 [Thomasclavelia cocleata]